MPLSRTEAYAILKLEEGSSFDLVKSAYKKAALRCHPDKNPDSNDPAEFQRLSEAYELLSKYLNRPSGYDSDYGYEDDYDDEDMAYYAQEQKMEFFRYLFEEMMRDRYTSRGHYHNMNPHQSYSRPRQTEGPAETPEEYKERLKLKREEQAAAAERRAQEAETRKLRQQQEREKERVEAENRQKAKVESKRAQVEAKRQKGQKNAQAQDQRAQTLRSEVFTAARAKDSVRVKKGVWEDSVDAAGGEVRKGCESFVKSPPKDLQETLLHIIARNGDADLVEWLDAHSADVEERNSSDLTAFHVALQAGHEPIVKHFFNNYPPKDDEHCSVYRTPSSTNLLTLSLESREPQIVYMILNSGLATPQDINEGWANFIFTGQQKPKSRVESEKLADIADLLKRFGGVITPPPTPQMYRDDSDNSSAAQESAPPLTPPPVQKASRGGKSRGRGRGRGKR